jgi:hypothetical protein
LKNIFLSNCPKSFHPSRKTGVCCNIGVEAGNAPRNHAITIIDGGAAEKVRRVNLFFIKA